MLGGWIHFRRKLGLPSRHGQSPASQCWDWGRVAQFLSTSHQSFSLVLRQCANFRRPKVPLGLAGQATLSQASVIESHVMSVKCKRFIRRGHGARALLEQLLLQALGTHSATVFLAAASFWVRAVVAFEHQFRRPIVFIWSAVANHDVDVRIELPTQ